MILYYTNRHKAYGLSIEYLHIVADYDEGKRSKVWKEVLEWDYATPSACLDEVYSKYTTANEKTHALADVYINSRPDSSWQHLVQTLYDDNELAAAKE